MPNLNLTVENDSWSVLKEYLEQNASTVLADKINNGVKIEKDGKMLCNKKTLKTFMQYAHEQAKSKAAKGEQFAFVDDSEVFGWAMHYFEEAEIIGTLYNEDGSEYQPPKPEYKPVHTPTVSPKTVPPKPKQASLFDFLSNADAPKKDDPTEEKIDEPIEEPDDDISGDEPTDFTVDENGEIIKPRSEKQYRPTSVYQKYLDMQKQYPHAVIAYRLGDFYEIFGDNAIKISNALSLTLTGRDCGLENRVAMVGFPYHAAEPYFQKIRQRYSLVVIDLDETKILDKLPEKAETPKPTPPTIVKEPEPAHVLVEDTNEDDDIEEMKAQTKHIDKDALCVLLELFNYELDVQ